MTGVRYSLGRAVPSLSKLESWLTIKYAVIVIPHLNTWLKDAAPLDVAWKKRIEMHIQNACRYICGVSWLSQGDPRASDNRGVGSCDVVRVTTGETKEANKGEA